MNIKCKTGLHDWNGCKCKVCGEIKNEKKGWDEECQKCLKCYNALKMAIDLLNQNEIEEAAIELLSIIKSPDREVFMKLKSITAIKLSNKAVEDVNECVENCNRYRFVYGGCSDVNYMYYQTRSQLKKTKERSGQLIELALKLDPLNERLSILLKQLSK